MKKIFKKKKSFKSIYILIFIFLFSIIVYFFYDYLNKDFFILNESDENFFTIPDDKGGKKVNNINKKILHLDLNKNTTLYEKNNFLLNFSIQIYASNDYKLIKDKILKIEQYVDKNDLYVVIFNHYLGKDYLLLYKNFNNKEVALEYCLKYVKIIDKCFIINAQKVT